MKVNDDTIRQNPPSGRFVLRIDRGLHASLRDRAREADTSLNRYCALKLASPGEPLDPAASAVVQRAASVLGDSLLGVVAFGSWARGDESSTSDLDVLLIADDRVPIARSLYRQWDDGPRLNRDGHQVEPHFVHLPAATESVSGLWAEVAMDGLILFERDFVVSRCFVGVRRRIVSGRLTLHVAQGQPYWAREP